MIRVKDCRLRKGRGIIVKNWWYYHKWYVIIGAILLGVVINLICNALGLFAKSPDLQIAYVGKVPLTQDSIAALQQIFTSLSGDYNQDGEVIVQINQYFSDSKTTNVDIAYYQYASEITLIGDISDCESYFFLMEDPLDFQRQYQLLALPDGSCPDEMDYSIEDKVFVWSDCPLLSKMESGSELLANLYFGRRCFYTDTVTDNLQECSNLWDMLYQSTKGQ